MYHVFKHFQLTQLIYSHMQFHCVTSWQPLWIPHHLLWKVICLSFVQDLHSQNERVSTQWAAGHVETCQNLEAGGERRCSFTTLRWGRMCDLWIMNSSRNKGDRGSVLGLTLGAPLNKGYGYMATYSDQTVTPVTTLRLTAKPAYIHKAGQKLWHSMI